MTSDEELSKSKKFPQYLATTSLCVGALSTGSVLGWTGSISEDMKTLSFNSIEIDDQALGWISSISTLAMILFCIPSAVLSNLIGRKLTLMISVIPFLAGWLLIIFSNSLWMIYLGRFINGIAAGSFAVCAPIYISEIAEKEIRGTLYSYIELNYTVGMFLAKLVGLFLNMKLYTIVMSVLPLLFAISFVLQPESPVFYVMKGRDEKAKESFRRLRGDKYNVNNEFDLIKSDLTCYNINSKETIIKSIKKKGTQKAMFVCFVLVTLQQIVGISVINSYTASIFKSTGVGLDEKISSMVVALFQVVAIFIASVCIDRMGRRILLIISNLGSAIFVAALAIFFTLKKHSDNNTISSIAWLPVVSLSFYMITYSIGMGPIPGLLNAELFPVEVKNIGVGIAALFNLIFVFLVVKFYFDIKNSIGTDGTFYMFAGISLIAAIFSYYFVPETKGKSFAQIQEELND